jgi:hypothetical protein
LIGEWSAVDLRGMLNHVGGSLVAKTSVATVLSLSLFGGARADASVGISAGPPSGDIPPLVSGAGDRHLSNLRPIRSGVRSALRSSTRLEFSRVTLKVNVGSVPPSGALRFRVENESDFNVAFGEAFEIEVLSEGSWVLSPLSPRGEWAGVGFQVPPGGRGPSHRLHIPAEAAPGSYRIVQRVRFRGRPRMLGTSFVVQAAAPGFSNHGASRGGHMGHMRIVARR